MFHSYTPCKRQKAFGFLTVAGSIGMEPWNIFLEGVEMNHDVKYANFSKIIMDFKPILLNLQ